MIAAIISRGHSGTRVLARTLLDSGFYMGARLNSSLDLVPMGKPLNIYRCCSLVGEKVKYLGNYEWDFSEAIKSDPTKNFKIDINLYLESILESKGRIKGWKLPEMVLIYPWITKMFRDVRYIYMIRDPLDCIMGQHLTDDLEFFKVPISDIYRKCIVQFSTTGRLEILGKSSIEQRIISWKYQYQIFKATPKPPYLIEIKYEDLILNQDNTLRRLKDFLGAHMTKVEVNTEPAFRALRTLQKERREIFDSIFESELKEYGYR